MNTDERRTKAAYDCWMSEANDPKLSIKEWSAVLARAIRESDEAAGMVMVPRVATLEMLEAGHMAAKSVKFSGISGMTIDAQIRAQTAREKAVWTAMIAAAEESNDP